MTLTFSEIIASLTLFAAIVGVWIDAKTRIKATEVRITELEKRLDRDNEREHEFMKNVREDIGKLYEKIDELKDLILTIKK